MNSVQFVKSFSRGQITIPKEIREKLGMSEDFWLKLIVSEGKIIAEPVNEENNIDKKMYLKTLLSIHTVANLSDDIQSNREDIEKRLKQNEL